MSHGIDAWMTAVGLLDEWRWVRLALGLGCRFRVVGTIAMPREFQAQGRVFRLEGQGQTDAGKVEAEGEEFGDPSQDHYVVVNYPARSFRRRFCCPIPTSSAATEMA
jgi:hypothetical protein